MRTVLNVLIGVFVLGWLSACSAPDKETSPPDTADKLHAMQVLIEVHNTLEMDRLDGIMVADFVRVAPDENTQSLDAYKQFLRDFHGLFSDFNMVVDESAVNADAGFIKWSVTGTYTGPGAAPAGSPIDVTGLGHYQFKDGKMTREFIGFNPGWFQEQLPARN